MSGAVLSDAQMGLYVPLRPFDGFESVYQGQAATVPIAFPGVLDINAGKEGFADNLLAGFPVPLGGRLNIWIPMAIHALGAPDDTYAYQLIWRIRNQHDVVEAIAAGRQPTAYHLPSEQLGRRENEAILATRPYYLIPGASDVEVFEQSEPGSGAATLNVLQQRYLPKITDPWVRPLTPTGQNGIWQQGVYQSTTGVNPSGPTWVPLWLDACGDELMILAYKTGEEPWDFASEGADASFSDTFGSGSGSQPINRNIGILISTGTMGS